MDAEIRYWEEIVRVSAMIPTGQEEFFRRLWRDGRLRYKGEPLEAGTTQELSARLLATAVRRRRSLFVVLPTPRREHAPALFGSSLLIDAVDKLRDPGILSNKVLLFGSGISMRAHLANTTVRGLSLSAVFRQLNLQQNAQRVQDRSINDQALSAHLPQVVCSLSPARPRDVFDRFRPTWIAADCDSDDISWLPDVLDIARDRGIPIIGWVSGYPTTVPDLLRDRGYPVLSWPPMLSATRGRSQLTNLSGRIVAEASAHPALSPLITRGDQSEPVADALGGVRSTLINLARERRGQLYDDALRSGWQCLRSIENLHVPLDFHDTECREFWGMAPATSRHRTFDRFVEAISARHPELGTRLSLAANALGQTLSNLSESAPPLWKALQKICIADAKPEHPRLVVFTSAARRKLFELALAAFEGVSTNDLATLGVKLSGLTSLGTRGVFSESENLEDNDRHSAISRHYSSVFLIGWPAIERYSRLQPLLQAQRIRVLGLPHQDAEIRRNIARFSDTCVVRAADGISALQTVGIAPLLSGAPAIFTYVASLPPDDIYISDATQRTSFAHKNPLWTAPDAVKETEWLLKDDDQDFEYPTATPVIDENDEQEGVTLDIEALTVDRVIRVEMTDGRTLLVDPDETINVVRGAAAYESMRSVRAVTIRPGDRIVFIHGQRRQNLYDFLIDRVHSHHSIRLHLALIRTWHDELRRAYRRWSAGRRNGCEELLGALRELGCQRTSALTMRFWVTGVIICPSDPDDLRRVARVLDIPFVSEHYLRIAKAADRLRGLHRGLANRLGNWIRGQAHGAASSSDDTVFDQELGLTMMDFRESLEVLSVRSVTDLQGLFLRSSLTRIADRGSP